MPATCSRRPEYALMRLCSTSWMWRLRLPTASRSGSTSAPMACDCRRAASSLAAPSECRSIRSLSCMAASLASAVAARCPARAAWPSQPRASPETNTKSSANSIGAVMAADVARPHRQVCEFRDGLARSDCRIIGDSRHFAGGAGRCPDRHVILSGRSPSVFVMRILHTSDWHIGRTFHGVDLLADQECSLLAIAELVSAEAVDVVVLPGDVYDRSIPGADAIAVCNRGFEAIRQRGRPLSRPPAITTRRRGWVRSGVSRPRADCICAAASPMSIARCCSMTNSARSLSTASRISNRR